MKFDVETHEAEVLEGMGKYLKKFQPTMLIEILTDEVGKNVEQLIQDLDYLYFNINDSEETIIQVDKICESSHFNYLICTFDIAKKLNLKP